MTFPGDLSLINANSGNTRRMTEMQHFHQAYNYQAYIASPPTPSQTAHTPSDGPMPTESVKKRAFTLRKLYDEIHKSIPFDLEEFMLSTSHTKKNEEAQRPFPGVTLTGNYRSNRDNRSSPGDLLISARLEEAMLSTAPAALIQQAQSAENTIKDNIPSFNLPENAGTGLD